MSLHLQNGNGRDRRLPLVIIWRLSIIVTLVTLIAVGGFTVGSFWKEVQALSAHFTSFNNELTMHKIDVIKLENKAAVADERFTMISRRLKRIELKLDRILQSREGPH
jgi:hypothetical protein